MDNILEEKYPGFADLPKRRIKGNRISVSALQEMKVRLIFLSCRFLLYQLMPLLEQLDKARAESLLSQNSEVQAAFTHRAWLLCMHRPLAGSG